MGLINRLQTRLGHACNLAITCRSGHACNLGNICRTGTHSGGAIPTIGQTKTTKSSLCIRIYAYPSDSIGSAFAALLDGK